MSHLSTLAAADLAPHLFWITSRAAGIAALLLSSFSVCFGLLMGGRLGGRRTTELRVVHEALSLATLAALAVHAFSLLGDGYLKPSVADVLVPFHSSYKEPYMAIGILAGWLLAILGLSYYARARIGVARWRVLHRFTALAWIGGIVHTLGEGTDAGSRWFLVMAGIVAVPALALLIVRTLRRTPSSPKRPSKATRTPAPTLSHP